MTYSDTRSIPRKKLYLASNYRLLACRTIMALTLLVGSAGAQLVPPPITTASDGNGDRPVSAAQAVHYVWIQEARAQAAQSFRAKSYPIDSIHRVIAAAGMKWVEKLRGTGVRGIQLDPSGHVDIAAEEEAYAKQQIAERLATPGLPFEDKAYTIMTAVQGFSDPYYPERLTDAENYLAKLDAMGEPALYWRFKARLDLVDTYYMLGRSQDVLKHGLAALDMVPQLTFFDRCLMFSMSLPGCGSGELYAATIDALTGQIDGVAKVDALNHRLIAAIRPALSDLSLDTGYVDRAQAYEETLNHMILGNSRLGMQAKPIISNFWLNRPTQDSAVVPVNDGRIHILEVAYYNCPPCLVALHALQRLKEQNPEIEVMLVSATSGSWGNRIVQPDEEIGYLSEYFLKKQGLTFPIAIWKGKLVPNEDDGMTPDYAGPGFTAYPPLSKPTIWIVDGRGIVRRVIIGFDHEKEAQITKTIQFLQRESGHLNLSTLTASQ